MMAARWLSTVGAAVGNGEAALDILTRAEHVDLLCTDRRDARNTQRSSLGR
jgi:hypothetical protein